MEVILDKFKKLVLTKTLLISLCISAIMSVIILLIFRFNLVYDTNDDYIISMLFYYGDNVILFLGYFLSNFLCMLQNLIHGINAFVVFQLLLVFISFTIINYVFIKKFLIPGLLLSFFLFGFYYSWCFIILQWTHTATIICVAASLLLLYATCIEKRRILCWVQISISLILFFVSSQVRFSCCEVCLCFFVLAIFYIVLRCFCSEKESLKISEAFLATIKKCARIVIVSVLGIAVCFGTNMISNHLKNTHENYLNYSEFNSARSAVQDYYICSYKDNVEFYNSIDIYSQEDLDLLVCYFIDDNFYNTKKLNAISFYSKEQGFGSENIYQVYFNAVKKKVISFAGTEIAFYVFIVLCFIVTIVFCSLIFKFRNKIKILFPICLIFIWCFAFLYLKNRINIWFDFLLLPLMFIVLINSIAGNRFSLIYSYLFSIAVLGLRIYSSFSRISFRVVFTFAVPAVLIVLFLFDKRDIKFNIKCIGFQANKILYFSFIICSLISLVISQIFTVKDISLHNTYGEKNKNEMLTSYISNHPEITFIYDYRLYPVLDSGRANPFFSPVFPSNTLFYGDWQIASDAYGKIKNQNDINVIFEEIIDSDSIRLLLDEHEEEYSRIFNEYYKNHYVYQDKKATLVLEESINGISVYKVVRN